MIQLINCIIFYFYMSGEVSKEWLPQSTNKLEVLESNDIQKKLDIINSTDLSKLQWFDGFISYLNHRKLINNSDKEIDAILLLINNNKIDDLIMYFDLDAGMWFFNDNESFNEFKRNFNDDLKNSAVNQTETKADQTETKASQTESIDQKELERNKTTLEKIKYEYKETIWILEKHSTNNPELKEIISEIINAEKWIDSIDKITSKEDFIPIKEVLKKYEQQIFATLHEEAIKTNNTKDLKKVALNFKELWVITEDRYNEIYDWALEIDKKKAPPTTPTTPELTPWYTARWDTLYKKTENASIVIKDGKMTCKSNESGLKLVDYNSLDEEWKALADKMKLDSEIKELKNDLGDNKTKEEILGIVKRLIQSKSLDSIEKSDIDYIIYDFSKKLPIFKDGLDKIWLNTNLKNEDKLKQIVNIFYQNITWNTNHSEIDNQDISYIISQCDQKLTDSNNETNDLLKQKETKLQELLKKYPNLDEKTIQEKIKSQETRMQDTVKFCDKFWLSALGHISYIKKFTREINKQEVINPIADDLWTWLEFKKWQKKYCKYLAILCGKQETDLFKPDDNGNWAGLNYETTKDDIENLLKNNKVLSFNWELKTLKMQELIEEWEKVDWMDYI